jgi:hypothetical protein
MSYIGWLTAGRQSTAGAGFPEWLAAIAYRKRMPTNRSINPTETTKTNQSMTLPERWKLAPRMDPRLLEDSLRWTVVGACPPYPLAPRDPSDPYPPIYWAKVLEMQPQLQCKCNKNWFCNQTFLKVFLALAIEASREKRMLTKIGTVVAKNKKQKISYN